MPREDIITGRAAQGYVCNLEVVGRFQDTSWASLDTFDDCANYDRQFRAGGRVNVNQRAHTGRQWRP